MLWILVKDFPLYNYSILSIWDVEMFWLSWDIFVVDESVFSVDGWTGSQGRQQRYWRWCGSGGHNPWLSCADWPHRAQLVLGFHPNSWARVFCGPLQSSLKEDSQIESLHEALRTLPLQPHCGEASLSQTPKRQQSGREQLKILATGEQSTRVKENIWQVTWKVLNQCGNSGCCQYGWSLSDTNGGKK